MRHINVEYNGLVRDEVGRRSMPDGIVEADLPRSFRFEVGQRVRFYRSVGESQAHKVRFDENHAYNDG